VRIIRTDDGELVVAPRRTATVGKNSPEGKEEAR
jgi:hypothetical protein